MISLSTRKWATIKRTAQIVQPNVAKKAKLEAKINELQEELKMTDDAIMQFDSAIVAMTGGYRSSDLIKRVVEPTSKTAEDGRILTVTKWIPTDIVMFDAEKNVYKIIPSENVQMEAEHCDEHDEVEYDAAPETYPETEELEVEL